MGVDARQWSNTLFFIIKPSFKEAKHNACCAVVNIYIVFMDSIYISS